MRSTSRGKRIDDPRFPHIAYRRGAAGWYQPVLRGTGIRVQTIAVELHNWKMQVPEIAADHELTEEQVSEALAFFEAHRDEIEASLADEQKSEPALNSRLGSQAEPRNRDPT